MPNLLNLSPSPLSQKKTASRIESTGVRNRIQISKATAELLIDAGKGHWVIPRDDSVNVKGKGILHTFWLKPNDEFYGGGSELYTTTSGSASVMSNTEDTKNHELVAKTKRKTKLQQRPLKKNVEERIYSDRDRLIHWMSDLLLDHIKKIVSGGQ